MKKQRLSVGQKCIKLWENLREEIKGEIAGKYSMSSSLSLDTLCKTQWSESSAQVALHLRSPPPPLYS